MKTFLTLLSFTAAVATCAALSLGFMPAVAGFALMTAAAVAALEI